MRDYKKEYKEYGSRPEVMAKKYERTKARRKALKNGLVSKNDGSDLHHVNGIYNNKVVKTTPKQNRGKKGEGGRKKGVEHNYPKNRKGRKYVR